MRLTKKRTEKDGYLSLGIQYLVYATILICIIILLAFIAVFNENIEIGDIGSFLSGTIGSIIALLVAFFTFLAFYFQYEANKQIQEQFKIQKTNDHFYKMLDIHLNNVESFSISSYRLNQADTRCEVDDGSSKKSFENFKTAINRHFITFPSLSGDFKEKPETILKQIKKNKIKVLNPENSIEEQVGKRAFLLIVKDFHFCHYSVMNANEIFNCGLTSNQCNELAYRIFFWGTYSNHIYGKLKKEKVEPIKKYLSLIRNAFRENKGAKYSFRYKTHEGETSVSLRFIPLSGHSSRLAHYYRHLYQTVKFLHLSKEDGLITELELDSNLKVLRAQFTNEEVLLLYYNYRIGFGKNWDKRGKHNYPFFREYNLLHNIPLYDNIPKEIEHPLNHFAGHSAKQRETNQDFKMFEWE